METHQLVHPPCLNISSALSVFMDRRNSCVLESHNLARPSRYSRSRLSPPMCSCVKGAEEVGTRNILQFFSAYNQLSRWAHAQLVAIDGDDCNRPVLRDAERTSAQSTDRVARNVDHLSEWGSEYRPSGAQTQRSRTHLNIARLQIEGSTHCNSHTAIEPLSAPPTTSCSFVRSFSTRWRFTISPCRGISETCEYRLPLAHDRSTKVELRSRPSSASGIRISESLVIR